MKKQYWLLALALAISLFAFRHALWGRSANNGNDDAQQATISWSQTSIHETLFPGITKSLSISFVSDKDLRSGKISTAGDISPILTVTPDSFDSIQAHHPYQFILKLSAPGKFESKSFSGRIKLESEHVAANSLNSLAINIDVKFSQSTTMGGVGFSYPTDWSIEQAADAQNANQQIILTSPGQSHVIILPNGGLPYGIDPESSFVSSQIITVQGVGMSREDYFTSEGTFYRTRVSFAPAISALPDFRIDFQPGQGDAIGEGEFVQILRSIQTP